MAKGKKPNPFGKKSANDFRRDLGLFEAIAGSQKKAAEKLGVDVSTYRAWKTGARNPSGEKASKFNRVFGQNKRKLQETEVQARIPKREKLTQTRRKAREPQRIRESVKIEASRDWIRSHFDAEFIRHNLSIKAPEYVAYVKGSSSYVQFLSPLDLDRIGKPKGQKSVRIYGLYTNTYVAETLEVEIPEEAQMDLFSDLFPVVDGFTEEWDLAKTLAYLERKFFERIKQVGRRKWNPTRFIGYELT